MNKIITYEGNEYLIIYNMSSERSFNGKTTHIMEITNVNKKLTPPNAYRMSWDNNDLTVQQMALELINSYIKLNIKRGHIDDFEHWDGNLDKYKAMMENME